MKSKKVVIIFSLFLLLIVLNNCSLNNNSDTSTITISLISNSNKSFAKAPSISDIDSFTLTVTGSGMSTITETYPAATTEIKLDVPSGNNREFNLTVNMNPDSSSAVLSWLGTETTNLTGGATAELTLDMEINETKLIMPDVFMTPYEIIMMNNINGDYTKTLDGSNANIGWGTNFRPYDFDVDSAGRIYIANYAFAAGFRRVVRIDDFNGTNMFPYADQAAGILALTVDRNNNFLYYCTSSTMRRVNLDGTGDISLAIGNITTIRGISVDEDGFLYIAGLFLGSGLSTIFKYNPTTQTVTDTFIDTPLNSPWDTMVKDNYVYVANTAGATDARIIRFDLNLDNPVGYGFDTGSIQNTSEGAFYGPRRFVAILNRKISIIDDHEWNMLDKLVSMDDINGTNWETFPTGADTGQTYFNFYMC